VQEAPPWLLVFVKEAEHGALPVFVTQARPLCVLLGDIGDGRRDFKPAASHGTKQ
jgi:hypothetical protein